MPKISVILTSYNHEKYIREAIDSVLKQTFTDFELIIWDDASSDNSWGIIQSYADARIRAVRNSQRLMNGNLNRALELALGAYIAIHHSDDVWELDKLEKQVAFLDVNPSVGATFTNVTAISEDSLPLANNHFYSTIFEQPNRTRFEWLRFFFNQGNALCHPSILIRKCCYEKCGLYRYGIAQLADFDMWIRLCLKYEIHVLPERLVKFRVRDNEANTSGVRPETKIRTKYEFYKVASNYLKISSAEELVKVFPSAEKHLRVDGGDLGFIFAMVGIEEQPSTIPPLFFQDLLFDAITEPARLENIRSHYNFDYKDFIELTGKNDVFLFEAVAERDDRISTLNHVATVLNEQIANRDNEIANRDNEIANRDQAITELTLLISEKDAAINAIRQSHSWQLTAPLRIAIVFFRRSKNFFRRALKSCTDGRERSALLTDIYKNSKILPLLRFRLGLFRKQILAKVASKIVSPVNLHAIQDLSSHRFGLAFDSTVPTSEIDLPEIDISVVLFESVRWIDAFSNSLLNQKYPIQKINIIFVDHGSKDDTVNKINQFIEKAGRKFASAKLIRQANLGFGAGHNRAMQESASPFCLVSNVDLEFMPDSILNLVWAAQRDRENKAASWEMRQIPYEHPKYYDPVTLETNWSSHACVLIRRSVYEAVGGYDSRIFMYAEDVELSYRFRSFGYLLKYVPSAVVIHNTYEHAGQVKPVQYIGSMLGSVYIRLRYGNSSDRLAGFALYLTRLIEFPIFPGSRQLIFRGIGKIVKNCGHFSQGRGAAKAYFPFYGCDYEMIRDGAFFQVKPPLPLDNAPLVSIVMRTYAGRETYLKQAIQSVLNQTYTSIELIVTEDGGCTQRELVSLAQKSTPEGFIVRFLENKKVGRCATGNAGLNAANGKYMMFLDDDDLIFADHVEVLVRTLEDDQDLSAAYSLAFQVLTRVSIEGGLYVEEAINSPGIFKQEWDYNILKDHNFLPIQSILFSRKLFLERGGFDVELDMLEDWNLWLRYGFKNKFKYVPKTTSLYRVPADPRIQMQRARPMLGAENQIRAKAIASLEKLGI